MIVVEMVPPAGIVKSGSAHDAPPASVHASIAGARSGPNTGWGIAATMTGAVRVLMPVIACVVVRVTSPDRSWSPELVPDVAASLARSAGVSARRVAVSVVWSRVCVCEAGA